MIPVAGRRASKTARRFFSGWSARMSPRTSGVSGPLAAQDLQKELTARGVKYCLPTFCDMHGISKGKVVPIEHIGRMMKGSELCTGAALDGVPQDVSDPEVASFPDPDSCFVLPTRPDTAWFASDLSLQTGEIYEACSRRVLRKVLADAAKMGFPTVDVGTELEWYVLRESQTPSTDALEGPGGSIRPFSTRHDLRKPAYDVARTLDNFNWYLEFVQGMRECGMDVYSFDHEDGVGQFEVDFRFSDALHAADRVVFLRLYAQEVARKHGGFACFMPKPFGHLAGNGLHLNISLASKDLPNCFARPENEGADKYGLGLSDTAYSFIAGLLKHLSSVTAVVACTPNSYKRLVVQGSDSGFTWAPVFQTYGGNNRTSSLRVPSHGGPRVELRIADTACNPYLAIAMAVAAGLRGVSQGLDPGAPVHAGDNLYEVWRKGPDALAARNIKLLPRSLEEALHSFERDVLSKEVFGPKLFDAWLEYKRREWEEFTLAVTDWEHKRYMKMF
eukprot:TRINITY_DN36483_c0_g1_i1.p1 TRINITY_DN36483_c0_g1~~TRINITY_DN36483_c0_g1_i1.p1  ORF type:complete len:503 (+),score=66.61 TRINITY_DN36483_c0_g1_i1:103-1611(+)